MTYAGNVGKKCGASRQRGQPVELVRPADLPELGHTMPVGWTNPAQFDFRLKAGSLAIGAASPQYAPERDRRGYRRDGSPDAGAYEYGAVPGQRRAGVEPARRRGRRRWTLRSATAALATRSATSRGAAARRRPSCACGSAARQAVREVQRLRKGAKPDAPVAAAARASSRTRRCGSAPPACPPAATASSCGPRTRPGSVRRWCGSGCACADPRGAEADQDLADVGAQRGRPAQRRPAVGRRHGGRREHGGRELPRRPRRR